MKNLYMDHAICKYLKQPWVQEMTNEPKLLRVSKAAHELGLHPVTVCKWIKAGRIAAIRVGNEARLPRSEHDLSG